MEHQDALSGSEGVPDLSRPLTGRTIVITRSGQQAAEFARLLEQFGATVVHCATIEIAEPESYDELDQAIDNLFGYDWLIFTSANGVDGFVRRLEALGHDVAELDEVRVCAIGPSTAERLHDRLIHVDLIPSESRAEGVFAALASYVGGKENLRNLVFLLPRAAVGRDFLPDALEEAGARIDVVVAYRTLSAGRGERGHIEALLRGGAVDCITFTSPSTVSNFASLFDHISLEQLLKDVAVACIGDVTAARAAQFNLVTHIQPQQHTIPELTRSIVEYFQSPGSHV